MKAWFKSRTMWLGFAAAFLGLIQTTMQSAPMSAQTSGIVMGVIGVLGVALRAVTKDAIGTGGA